MSTETSLVDSVRLQRDFLRQYKGKQPKWGFQGLGFIVYVRTYSRKKANGKLEEWWETVRRFTEGNYKIEAQRLQELGKLTPERFNKLRLEMERFYHLAFNLVITPPGRGLWMSGTEYAERVGDAENNCWGVSMRPQEYLPGSGDFKVSFAPVFTFDQAMKGGGVGVNVQRKYVSKIPAVSNQVELYVVADKNHPDFDNLVSVGVLDRDTVERRPNDLYYLTDDSREGWATSLGMTIDEHYKSHYENLKHNDTIRMIIDVTDVREEGRDIKGFGGTASGPKPLATMLYRVNTIINNRFQDHVTGTEWGDVIQNIGCCVVAGNVRRTALILVGDQDDKQFVESKNYSLDENLTASQWRWASNNSVDIASSTDRATLKGMAVNIYFNGEPGYVNMELSRNFGRIIDGFILDIDGEVEIFNPCGEVTLPNASPCNLFEVNLVRIHELIALKIEGENLYEEAFYLAVRYAYRITFRPYDWAATREIVYRHRRLGVGITGITDWVLLAFGERAILGFNEDGDPIFNTEVTSKLDQFYKFVRNYNIEHAQELEASPSIKVTTVKPSGTISLLMGVSPGQHFHWAAYMIRRIRMSINAPLIPVLQKCGYYMEPAIKGFNKDGSPVYDTITAVVEFPVKAPTAEHPMFQSAGDVPLAEQAALQALLATYWSDNAVSATLSFRKAAPKPVFFEDGSQLTDKFGQPILHINKSEEEAIIEEITDVLDRYKTVIKSTSLLPYATDTYPQMPYEEISKEKYDQMTAKIKAKPWEVIQDEDLDAEQEEVADSSAECVGGSCPIK